MKQRPPKSDDATSEEQAPEFDGTSAHQLDDTYRVNVLAAGESATGTIGFPSGSTNRKETTNRVRALELAPTPLTESGNDPDATGVFVVPKIDQ
jgi:hypothetical protein